MAEQSDTHIGRDYAGQFARLRAVLTVGVVAVVLTLTASLSALLFSGHLAQALDRMWPEGHVVGAGHVALATVGATGLAMIALAAYWQRVCQPCLAALEARSLSMVAAEREIERSLTIDGLTGLANRRALSRAIARHAPERRLALLHVELAGFHSAKAVLGLETGEQILRYAADLLRSCASASDLVARIDTAEFAIATRQRTDPEQLQELAVEAVERLSAPVEIEGHQVALSPVIGIATRGGRFEPPEALLANADLARLEARAEGGLVHFSHAMRERLLAGRQTAQDLMRAIARSEIEPFFQPQIEAATGRLIGFEALVRWRHPERGILNPIFFLHHAAEAGLGDRIARIMSRRSTEALGIWRERGLDVPRISLNLTAEQIVSRDFADLLLFDLDRAGLAPQDLCIEILESAMIKAAEDSVTASLKALKTVGFSIDLDDFGTGNAALGCLPNIAIDRVKIDRSLVRDIHLRPELRSMTGAMMHLTKTLGLGVLAEGIETEAEWRLLVDMGVDSLQGFAIGKPMPAEAVPGWIADHSCRLRSGAVIAAA